MTSGVLHVRLKAGSQYDAGYRVALAYLALRRAAEHSRCVGMFTKCARVQSRKRVDVAPPIATLAPPIATL